MKRILLLLFVSALSLGVFAQAGLYRADPGLSQAYFVDAGGNPIDPNNLSNGQTFRLRISIYNGDAFVKIPSQSTRIQISLGDKIQVVGGVAGAPFNNLFAFTTNNGPGGQEIIANQIADIPGNFAGTLEFNVKVTGNTLSTGSNVVANFFVPNNNPNGEVLSDIQPANNASSLFYKTTIVVPVKFVSMDAANVNCMVNVNWKVAEEINVDKYEVEVSNNGASFRSVASVKVQNNNNGNYNASFAIPSDLKGAMLFVRVKEVDMDAKYAHTQIKTVKGNCDGKKALVVFAYPNPVTATNFINIAAKEGIFDGKYRMELIDNGGKLYQVKEVQLSNQVSVPFEFKTALSPGNYMIRISNVDGSQTSTVQFVKVGVL